jgi:hypothetical protein
VAPIISIPKETSNKKRPFYIILTIDTESGYVTNNEERLWQVNYPQLYQGFYYGIKNWLDLLNKHKIRANFMLSGQCFSAKGREKKLIDQQLSNLLQQNHELGYHLHPRSDQSLQQVLGKKLQYTSSKFYSKLEIDKMLKAARYLLEKNLSTKINKQIISFRWGNYGLYQHAFSLLENSGFIIDSSACSGKKGHELDDKVFDWSKIKTPFPFYLKNSQTLEIPVTTFSFLNKILVVNPIYHNWLEQIFIKYWFLNNKINNQFFFVILSHSSEGTHKNGEPTRTVFAADQFIKKVKKYENVRFITFKEAYEIYHREKHEK